MFYLLGEVDSLFHRCDQQIRARVLPFLISPFIRQYRKLSIKFDINQVKQISIESTKTIKINKKVSNSQCKFDCKLEHFIGQNMKMKNFPKFKPIKRIG
jgi:hypothetical protein